MGNGMSKPETHYSPHLTLKGHTRPINALRFSPDGELLVSAASDSELRIWSTNSGACVQTLANPIDGPITDVIWALNKSTDQGIIFGCADGTVHTYVRPSNESEFRSVIATCAHEAAIESIHFDPINKRVATAGGGEVKVWNMNSDWSLDLHASAPASDAATSRTVHFSNNGQSLIATYLETSKIVAWNVNPWNQLWSANSTTRIGHAALSPDGRHMLIHNFRDGVDGYTIPNMFRHATFHAPVAVKKPKQVAFDSSGTLVIQGSDKGLVYISDFQNTAPLQTLVHSSVRDALVPVVTSHSNGDQHWIASGCSSIEPTIKVWKRKQSISHEAVKFFAGLGIITVVSYVAKTFGLWDRGKEFIIYVIAQCWRVCQIVSIFGVKSRETLSVWWS